MPDFDRAYYERRHAEETERVAQATSDVARAAHRQLAELYAQRLAVPSPPPYRPGMASRRAA